MRTTLTITLDKELAEFIRRQPGILDPSAFINKLIHDDIQRQMDVYPAEDSSSPNDMSKRDLEISLELSLDEQIPAAG